MRSGQSLPQKNFFENKNINSIFLGVNNQNIASQTTPLMDYYKISKILLDILNRNTHLPIKAGLRPTNLPALQNAQIFNNLMFILLIKIGNNFIKEYNNLIKTIILKHNSIYLLNKRALQSKSDLNTVMPASTVAPGFTSVMEKKLLKKNNNLLKYLILKKLVGITTTLEAHKYTIPFKDSSDNKFIDSIPIISPSSASAGSLKMSEASSLTISKGKAKICAAQITRINIIKVYKSLYIAFCFSNINVKKL